MNREIKFRVWRFCHSINKHKFYYLNYLKISRNEGADISFQDSDTNYFDDSVDSFSEDTELHQYTGIKDKDGREIYEGDILYWNNPITIKKENYFIVKHGDFGYKRDAYDCHYGFYCNPVESKAMYGIKSSFILESKVIGNIFENPELLK